MKPLWRSKTLWLNVITLGLALGHPVLGIDTSPVADPKLLAIANILLRLVTKDKIVVTE